MIANGLRAARQAAGLSQGELAARAGVTRQTIGALEAQQYAPTLNVALRLARVLGQEVSTLFWLAEDETFVQAELLAGGLRQQKMPQMDGIEGAAEQGDFHIAERIIPEFALSLGRRIWWW